MLALNPYHLFPSHSAPLHCCPRHLPVAILPRKHFRPLHILASALPQRLATLSYQSVPNFSYQSFHAVLQSQSPPVQSLHLKRQRSALSVLANPHLQLTQSTLTPSCVKAPHQFFRLIPRTGWLRAEACALSFSFVIPRPLWRDLDLRSSFCDARHLIRGERDEEGRVSVGGRV